MKLFFEDKPVVGLDISETVLKTMSIDQKKSTVKCYGSLSLDAAKAKESMEANKPAYLAEQITKLFVNNVQGQPLSNHIIIGVPTNKTYSRTFSIPLSEERHIASAVQLEAERYIPIPSESLYIDYEIIQRTKTDLTIIVSAAPKNLIDSVSQAVSMAGFLPVAIEPSVNATTRVLIASEEGLRTTLVLDIGSTNTDIAILSGGVVLVTGSAAIGGSHFTANIARDLNVSIDRAHQYKILDGLSPSEKQRKIRAALEPNLHSISLEAQKVIRYYNERISAKKTIEQILIVGGGANVPGLGDYFTNEFVMPARVASPWQQLDFGGLEKPHRYVRPQYITSAGLASVTASEVRQ